MIALIDGDELSYKLAFKYQDIVYKVINEITGKEIWRFPYKQEAIDAIENETDLDIVKEVIPLSNGCLREDAESLLEEIVFKAKCNSYIIMLSGYDNFRYKLATLLPYKGDRSKDDKPFYLEYIKQYFRDNHPYQQVDFLEADDLLSYNGYNKYDTHVICSTDKDLRTVPSNNYNIMTEVLQKIDLPLAQYNFYTQLCIGDSTDNIPSPYNLGEKTTENLILPLYNEKVISNDYYYQTILPVYMDFLTRKGKDGEFKTKWYKKQNIRDILTEVGNLLWMHRTLDLNERWVLPNDY